MGPESSALGRWPLGQTVNFEVADGVYGKGSIKVDAVNAADVARPRLL